MKQEIKKADSESIVNYGFLVEKSIWNFVGKNPRKKCLQN